MDRFVTRTPTWKTLTYPSKASQSVLQHKSITKNAAVNNKSKPLQQNQFSEILSNGFDFEKQHPTDSQLANAEHFNANSNDSGLSSSSSVSPHDIDKKPLTPTKNSFDCTEEKENEEYMPMTRSPKSYKKVAVSSGLQVEKTFQGNKNFNPEVNNTPERPFKTNNMIMARIQRDFNSPSAASRMRAIKAMKSPTKSTYCQFDIPESEQSFILPDPPSLQEIMRNIVVYVEVRSGEDNRSAGVRKVIEALGARVSLSLNRETTHVIFKDGLLSTFKKANQLSIPIVSILWIEACKNQRRICDPKDYPISNLDRYENPELYTKMKRIKSMQPDSECNKRIRAKPGGTPKDSTPTQKTGNQKKTSTFIGGTPSSSTNKKKTDITQFFKKLDKSTPSSASKIDDGMNGTKAITESPATQLLNRIHSECYTPLNKSKSIMMTEQILPTANDEGTIEAGIRSNIFVGINATVEASCLPKTRGRPRRQSLMTDCEIETATHCMNTMAISFSTPGKSRNRRRSSTQTAKDMSLAVETPNITNNTQPILEENNEMVIEKDTFSNSVRTRRTLYAIKTMDETNLMDCETNEKVETPKKRSSRRRTINNSKTMETSEMKDVPIKVASNVSNRRKTCFNFNSLELTEIPEISDNKTANMANKETEVYSTKEVEMMSTPSAIKAAKPSNRRRTLYRNQTITETNVNTFTPNVTTSSSICLTPTNFQTGRVSSSTLLEDNGKVSNLVATTTAGVTSGKLLEETEECVTPLIFSSSRQPGIRRRTLFDTSMDIITQRLQCINQSARRSLAPPIPSAEAVNTIEKPISTPINVEKSNYLINTTTPKSSTESLHECNGNGDRINVNKSETITMGKRRKLFMPNEMLDAPTKAAPDSANMTNKTSNESDKLGSRSLKVTTDSSTVKGRRTLMPISQPQITTNFTNKGSISSKITTTTVRKRRSTLDFEQINTTRTKSINVGKDSSTASAGTKDSNSQQQFKVKKARVLVHTNMHQQQVDVIREAIDKLRSFVLESCVNNTTTHVVSLEPRRTLNLLRALARGLWILDYSWITDSLKAGKWLPEESYELQDFSRAIEICHSERQAFGNNYKCDLFRNIGAFYITSNCGPLNKDNMRELITLCGGHVVHSRQNARYIIGDANRSFENKLYLTPFWVIDSITKMQLMKASKYMYPLPN